MKNVLSILILAVSFAVAQAQTPVFPAQLRTLVSGSNAVLATTTRLFTNYVVNVSEQQYVGIQIQMKAQAALAGATPTVTLKFAETTGGNSSTYETTPKFSIAVALNEQTNVVVVTNLFVPGASSLNLVSIANTNAVALTNLHISYLVKKMSPGK